MSKISRVVVTGGAGFTVHSWLGGASLAVDRICVDYMARMGLRLLREDIHARKVER
jgi:hypothetical protein